MKQASTNTVKSARNDAGANAPTSQKSRALTAKSTAMLFGDAGSPAPWPCPDFFAGVAAAVAGFACGAAAGSLSGGGGQVMAPSFTTVKPRMASSSMLTLMMPSLVLHNSSVTRSRLVEYRVED